MTHALVQDCSLVSYPGSTFSREKRTLSTTQHKVLYGEHGLKVPCGYSVGQRWEVGVLKCLSICFMTAKGKKNFFFFIRVRSKNLLSFQLETKTIMEALQTNVQKRKRKPTDY